MRCHPSACKWIHRPVMHNGPFLIHDWRAANASWRSACAISRKHVRFTLPHPVRSTLNPSSRSLHKRFLMIFKLLPSQDPHIPFPSSLFTMNSASIAMQNRSVGFVLSASPKTLQHPTRNLAISKLRPIPILHRTCSTPNLKTVYATAISKKVHVRTYTNSDPIPTQKLAASLASAFEQDPLFNYICNSKEVSRLDRHRIMMEGILNLELSRPADESVVHVSEDNGTVAIWHHVGHWKMSLSMQLQTLVVLFRAFGWEALRFINIMQSVEEAHPTEPHMHLFVIGTNAATRGRGNGSRVISKMLEQCDRAGIPAYLESSNEKNLTFYQKHGFEVMRKIPGLPEDCPPVFAMWRTPRPILKN